MDAPPVLFNPRCNPIGGESAPVISRASAFEAPAHRGDFDDRAGICPDPSHRQALAEELARRGRRPRSETSCCSSASSASATGPRRGRRSAGPRGSLRRSSKISGGSSPRSSRRECAVRGSIRARRDDPQPRRRRFPGQSAAECRSDRARLCSTARPPDGSTSAPSRSMGSTSAGRGAGAAPTRPCARATGLRSRARCGDSAEARQVATGRTAAARGAARLHAKLDELRERPGRLAQGSSGIPRCGREGARLCRDPRHRGLDSKSRRADLTVAYLSLTARLGEGDEQQKIDFATVLTLLPCPRQPPLDRRRRRQRQEHARAMGGAPGGALAAGPCGQRRHSRHRAGSGQLAELPEAEASGAVGRSTRCRPDRVSIARARTSADGSDAEHPEKAKLREASLAHAAAVRRVSAFRDWTELRSSGSAAACGPHDRRHRPRVGCKRRSRMPARARC